MSQPIAAQNVIDYLLAALENGNAHNLIFEIGGPGRMSYAELMVTYGQPKIVADTKEVVRRLKEKGVQMLSEAPIESRPGVFALFSVDPENNFVEFVEYPDIASYRPDLFGK